MNNNANYGEARKNNIPTITVMTNGQATATALRDVTDIHISARPDKDAPLLVDARGAVIPTSRTTLMARIDAKGSEEITIRRSTMWFVGTVIAVLPVAIVLAVMLVGWARDDQTQKMQIQQLQNDLNVMKDFQKTNAEKLDKLADLMTDRKVQDAKVQGYTLGQSDAGATGHKNK